VKITTLILTLIPVASLLYADDGHLRAFDDSAAILHDRSVLACFSRLVRRSYSGFATSESAAFLVSQADGSLRCVDWPPTAEFKKARWSGPMPKGVVAAAHTHPLSVPYPSPDDITEARRTRMPIFVLTPNMINVVHADGRAETLVYKTWTVSPGF
jgi:hypothetical protein